MAWTSCAPISKRRRTLCAIEEWARGFGSRSMASRRLPATGTVLSGSVHVGDRIQLSPSGLFARVRSLHAQNRPADDAHAGERCALNLAGPDITKEAIKRGEVALDPEL